MKNYSEHQVVNELSRKSDIRIHGKDISILYGEGVKGDIGIKSKGKIDFLVNHCGYHKKEIKNK